MKAIQTTAEEGKVAEQNNVTQHASSKSRKFNSPGKIKPIKFIKNILSLCYNTFKSVKKIWKGTYTVYKIRNKPL